MQVSATALEPAPGPRTRTFTIAPTQTLALTLTPTPQVDGVLLGDPIELTTLRSIGWTYDADSSTASAGTPWPFFKR